MTIRISKEQYLKTYGHKGTRKRKKYRKTEHQMQCDVFRWLRWAGEVSDYPPLKCAFAIPNGAVLLGDDEGRGRIQGAKLKAEGRLPGVPDIFIPIPAKSDGGLFIELKTPIGEVSSKQSYIHKLLRSSGYSVKVCRSVDSVIDLVLDRLPQEVRVLIVRKNEQLYKAL